MCTVGFNRRKSADPNEPLAQAKARYRGLLEAAPDALNVGDEGGEIALLNTLASQLSDCTRDKIAGRRVTDFMPTHFAEGPVADSIRSEQLRFFHKAAIHDYLANPFKQDELHDAIRRVIDLPGRSEQDVQPGPKNSAAPRPILGDNSCL